MELSTVVAQFNVDLDINRNLHQIESIVEKCFENDIIVLPEGSLSGYSDDLSFLERLDMKQVNRCLDYLEKLVIDKQVHMFVGACLLEENKWFNSAIYLSPRGERFIYRKVNLATHEREKMSPGNDLPVLTLNVNGKELKVGIQLCREIRYPEQWNALARQGAEVIVYMTHAIDDQFHMPVWRSHLISHAAAIQRFVLASNTAHSEQLCPSMIINPKGHVLQEEFSEKTSLLRQKIDVSQVSDWYLNQARTDVVSVQFNSYEKRTTN